MQEELEQLEALQTAEAIAEEEFRLPDMTEKLGTLELKGVKYVFYDNIGNRGELGASCEIQDEIYELEEEVEFEGTKYPVTIWDGTSTFCNNIILDTFTVPSHIKYVASHGRLHARNVIYPDTVEYINNQKLFVFIDELESVTFPEGLACYGYDVHDWISTFSEQNNLKSMTIPEGTKAVNGTFSGCENIEEIILPESLELISFSAFEDCKSVTTIKIPDNVHSIYERAFDGCENLTSIEFPNGLEQMVCSFSDCNSLTEIIIPDSVVRCTGDFRDVTNLQLLVFPKDATIDSYSLPDNGCLEKVVFPNTITDLDINFPESVKTIEVPEDLVDYLQKKYPDIEVLARE